MSNSLIFRIVNGDGTHNTVILCVRCHRVKVLHPNRMCTHCARVVANGERIIRDTRLARICFVVFVVFVVIGAVIFALGQMEVDFQRTGGGQAVPITTTDHGHTY